MPPTGHRKADSGIASPTGHRRSNNYRKVVAQRSDSRSAEPIRNETGTSVPLSTGRSRERPVLSFASPSPLRAARTGIPCLSSQSEPWPERSRKGERPAAKPQMRECADSSKARKGERPAAKPQTLASCERSKTSSKTQTTPCKARGRPVYIKQQLDAFITCHQATIPRGYPLRGTRLS